MKNEGKRPEKGQTAVPTKAPAPDPAGSLLDAKTERTQTIAKHDCKESQTYVFKNENTRPRRKRLPQAAQRKAAGSPDPIRNLFHSLAD